MQIAIQSMLNQEIDNTTAGYFLQGRPPGKHRNTVFMPSSKNSQADRLVTQKRRADKNMPSTTRNTKNKIKKLELLNSILQGKGNTIF